MTDPVVKRGPGRPPVVKQPPPCKECFPEGFTGDVIHLSCVHGNYSRD